MKSDLYKCILAAACFTAFSASQATERFVSPVGQHVAPFLDWTSAATNIQAAIDVAIPGDTIWVTNGIYNTGGIRVGSALTNRVALTKALLVHSVNGPAVTIIEGRHTSPSVTNGALSVRCAWLTNGASLSGFTLRNGSTAASSGADIQGGGAYCLSATATLSNCWIVGNSAYNSGGGVSQGTLRGCLISSNTASSGGGVFNAWLRDCTAQGNRAYSGGGAYSPSNNVVISNSTILLNTAFDRGGGVYQGSLQHCLVQSNSSISGGGAYGGVLVNSKVHGNGAREGGGTYNSSLTNSFVASNRATNLAGGVLINPANAGQLQNCTLVWNQAYYAGGISGGSALNSIICFNLSSASLGGVPWVDCKMTNGCAYPQPASPDSLNVINSDPLLFSDGIHLRIGSPCIAAGINLAAGTDLDGQPWNTPPSIGCDEWSPQPLVATSPRVMPDNVAGRAQIVAEVAGAAADFTWLKNGTQIQNDGHYNAAHSSTLQVNQFSSSDAGSYQVVTSNQFGVATSAVVTVTVACVDSAGLNPAPPYSNWSSAAQTIQDAIDAALPNAVVLVTNGIYSTGGRYVSGDMTNRVVLDKAVTVMSVNGTEHTVIEGAWDPSTTNGPSSIRCAWVGEEGVLGGFTLRNGSTPTKGGGLWSPSSRLRETAIACVITNCRAANGGGGVYRGHLRDCSITGNQTPGNGGGAAESLSVRCSITANQAPNGGGIHLGLARRSLIATNSANGIYEALAESCSLIGNFGSGAMLSRLQSCLLKANSVYGSSSSTNLNCTFLENGSATLLGRSTNCIMWFNGLNPSSDMRVNCLLQSGEGSGVVYGGFSLFPNFLSDGVHLAADSPAIGAGANIGLSGSDLDGQPWANPPSIGCDQWTPQPLLIAQPRIIPGSEPRQAVLLADIAGQAPFCSWTKNGIQLLNSSRFSGAQTPRLLIRDFGPADAGNYQVVASNNFGVVTSAVATITVACVDAASSAPQSPYDGWDKAAPTIQQAVDSADVSTVILVTNGVYATGGRAVTNDMFNRVVLDKPITLLSVNGPETTFIEGAWDPAATNGPASIRCAWVANGGVLGGFTLRNGSAPTNGGGVWSADPGVQETLINCWVTNCYAVQDGGGVYQGRLRDCVLSGNVAKRGGGAAVAIVERSLVERNAANEGGGVWDTIARGCRVLTNHGAIRGGGAAGKSLLMSCLLASNTGGIGAGVDGGGFYALLYHCTVVSNRSPSYIGGVNFCSAYNSIIYFNKAEPHSTQGYEFADAGSSAGFYSICSPRTRVSSVTNNPQLVDLAHIAVNSPCVGAATNLGNLGFGNLGYGDIDGEPWNASPSIGCDEPLLSGLTGPLALTIDTWLEVAAGGLLPLNALVSGRASLLQWDFGDGLVISNAGFNANHTWINPGDYTVKATVFNSDHPEGVSSQVTVQVIPLETPVLGSPSRSGSSFSLQFTGLPGLTYEVQMATNLTPPVAWQPLQTINSTGGLFTVTDPAANGVQRFYRLRIPTP